MDIIAGLLIPFAIFFGITTSYQDYKEHRVRNKWIVAALMYSFGVFTIILSYYYIQGLPLNIDYIYDYFLNIFFALFAGVIIWFGGLWPAGDAKLFVAYSALVPLSVYQWGYVQHFPAFIILINTFIPLFIFYFLRVMFRTTLEEKIVVTKSMFKPMFLINNVLFIFAFLWIIQLGLNLINKYTTLANNIFVILAMLFLVMFFFTNIIKIDFLIVCILISSIEIFFDYKNIFTIAYLNHFLIIFFLFIFLRYFVINLGFKSLSETIYIEDLKPGMVPAENIIKDGEEYKKKKIIPLSFISGLLDNSEKNRIFHSVSEGLTKEEIKKTQKLHSRGYIKDHSIVISQIVPFAPFMFIGVLFTILCKGNLVFYLISVLEKFI